MWSILTFILLRKTRNISTKRCGTACKFLKFCFYEQACSETGCASVKATKITKNLDLEKKSKIILWWGWGQQNFTNISKVKGERNYKHEFSSNILIYQNRLYYHSQPCPIVPITKQTSFYYKAVWLLAPIEPQKSYYRHTLLWLGNNLFSALFIVHFNTVPEFKSLPILLLNPNTVIENDHMTSF